MEMCSDGHEEVVFESETWCPACGYKEHIEELGNKLRDAGKKIESLEGEVSDLQGELDDLK